MYSNDSNIKFYEVISTIIEANKINLVDNINIRRNRWIAFYYKGEIKAENNEMFSFENGTLSSFSKKEYYDLKRLIRKKHIILRGEELMGKDK